MVTEPFEVVPLFPVPVGFIKTKHNGAALHYCLDQMLRESVDNFITHPLVVLKMRHEIGQDATHWNASKRPSFSQRTSSRFMKGSKIFKRQRLELITVQ